MNMQKMRINCAVWKLIPDSYKSAKVPNLLLWKHALYSHRFLPSICKYHALASTSYSCTHSHIQLLYPPNFWHCIHGLHKGPLLADNEVSKIEQTTKALKAAAKTKQEQGDKSTAEVVKPAELPKRSLGKRIWDELLHYYHGFKLLLIDIKVSSRLAWKIFRGGDLTRRERKQLVRTVSDLFRIVPFSVFIIVPFMELLLPIAIKIFPNMLPSTFQTTTEKEKKFRKQLKIKLETAKFLQDTLDEMAVQAKGETHSHTAKQFAIFFEKVRVKGEEATNEEIIKYSKLFEDEITLDTLSRPQLTALCRLLELQPIGTNNFLRFGLRMKLRSLKTDDQMIQNEGIDTLTVPELQAACRARGMRTLGIPVDRLRFQLSQWLELSLSEQIPPSLLLLSRALYLPETLPAYDQLKATISALPEAAATEAKFKIGEKEGKVDNKTKIELIKHEEEAIKKEEEERIQELQEKQKLEEATKAKTSEAIETASEIKKAAIEPSSEVLRDIAEEIVDKAQKIGAKEEKVTEKLTKEDFENIEDALENISRVQEELSIEKEKIEDLKEDMEEYRQEINDLKEVVKSEGKEIRESKAALRLSKKVGKMVKKMNNLVDDLTKERKSLQQQIDDKIKEGVSVQQERSDIISVNELVLAIRRIQKVSDDTKLQQIADVLTQMDVDHDGAVEVEHVLKVVEVLGQENVKVTPQQMSEIIDMLMKEEMLESEKHKKQETETKSPDSQNVSNQTENKEKRNPL